MEIKDEGLDHTLNTLKSQKQDSPANGPSSDKFLNQSIVKTEIKS